MHQKKTLGRLLDVDRISERPTGSPSQSSVISWGSPGPSPRKQFCLPDVTVVVISATFCLTRQDSHCFLFSQSRLLPSGVRDSTKHAFFLLLVFLRFSLPFRMISRRVISTWSRSSRPPRLSLAVTFTVTGDRPFIFIFLWMFRRLR